MLKLLSLHTQTQPEQEENHGTTTDTEKKRKVPLKEKKSCEGCNGNCPLNPPYILDVTREWAGVTYHQSALCHFGQKRLNAAQSHIPTKFIGKTFDDYQTTSDNAEAVKIAKWYVAEKPARSLYFYGNTGTGKTFLASIVAQEFDGVQFINLPELTDLLKETFDSGGTEKLLNRYVKCDLLILDDLGAGNVTAWTISVVYRLINSRYNANRPLIATSNASLDDLAKMFGRRIISRLSEMCIQAFLGTTDRRK